MTVTDNQHFDDQQIIEAELVDEYEDAVPAQRGAKYATTYTSQDVERKPVIPAWVRSRDERAAHLRNHGGFAAYTVTWHATRLLPVHVPKTIGYVIRGGYRFQRDFRHWAFDHEHKPTRAEAIRTLNLPESRSQYRQRKDRVKFRGPVFWLTLLVASGASYWGFHHGVWWERAAALAVVGAALAVNGRPIDKPMYSPAIVRAQYTRLTPDLVEASLIAAGLAKLDKEGRHEIRWVDPCQRDGNGWLAVVDLPPGVTVAEAIDSRASIASGLHVPVERCWLERDARSERRLRIWVADVAMADMKMPPWPLLKRGTVDTFGEFPFALNARGRVAKMSLAYTNVLVGAIPRMGKTYAARLVALAAALDPTAELHIVDLKGGGDWIMFEPVAHLLVVGDEPDELKTMVMDLDAVRTEMGRRYRMLRQMTRDKDPRVAEAKTTRELANVKSLGLHPIVYIIDEVQRVFVKTHEDKDKADELITDLIKRGPAVGVIAIVATQKPDAQSLPSGIRDNVGTRFGLRVSTHNANDMVLGSGMSVRGYRAHEFNRNDRGVGYLVGASDNEDAEVVHVYQVDSIQAEQVIARAWGLRNDAGTLSGQAIGHQPVQRSSLLRDVLEVMDGDRQHCALLAERLAANFPEQYAGWDATKVAGALRGQGVTVPQSLKVDGVNKTGVLRRAIESVMQARDIDSD